MLSWSVCSRTPTLLLDTHLPLPKPNTLDTQHHQHHLHHHQHHLYHHPPLSTGCQLSPSRNAPSCLSSRNITPLDRVMRSVIWQPGRGWVDGVVH